MRNSDREQYRYEDFTEKNYRKLIRLAKKRFRFIGYAQIRRYSSFLLWRHDIDFSVHRARAVAGIEQEEGIAATYFVQLDSIFYNVFEQEIKGLLQEINGLGHRLGLHFDATAFEVRDDRDLKTYLGFARNILEKLLNVKIKAFSYHNPSPSILRFDELMYSGMVNTYARYFKENVAYCSDSNGYWRHDRLDDILVRENCKRLQVLTHPGWWQTSPMSPRERIDRCIRGRANRQHTLYDRLLRECERKNVGKPI